MNSILSNTEGYISDLEDKITEIIQSEKDEEKK